MVSIDRWCVRRLLLFAPFLAAPPCRHDCTSSYGRTAPAFVSVRVVFVDGRRLETRSSFDFSKTEEEQEEAEDDDEEEEEWTMDRTKLEDDEAEPVDDDADHDSGGETVKNERPREEEHDE